MLKRYEVKLNNKTLINIRLSQGFSNFFEYSEYFEFSATLDCRKLQLTYGSNRTMPADFGDPKIIIVTTTTKNKTITVAPKQNKNNNSNNKTKKNTNINNKNKKPQ